MLDFLLSSSNSHKAKELQDLFDPKIIKISLAGEALEVEESGSSYEENAFLKAKAYFEKFKRPTVADDSGLEILSLKGELGTHSARFGGGSLSSNEQIELLLKKMQNHEDAKREAFFICSLCFYLRPEEYYFFEGKVLGKIGKSPKGNFGFGYDPIFFPNELEKEMLSLAEAPEWKAKCSHRARAAKLAENFFLGRA